MISCSLRHHPLIYVAVAICLLAPPVWAQKEGSMDQPAASVNGKSITKGQYERELNIFKKRAAQQGRQLSDADLVMVKNEILENLINAEVLYQQSQKVGVKVDDQAIDEQVASIKKRFPNDAAFQNALVEMQVSEKEIRGQIQRGLAINQLLDNQVRQNIKVTEAESKEFYDKNPNLFQQPEQVKASHILIKVAPDADKAKKEEARQKIEQVQKKVGQGEDFGTLAKTHSEGPTAEREGDLGFFRRGQMVKPFEDAAFSMKVGEVSDIVQTQFGYHLIKVTEKKSPRTVTYDEVQLKLERHLKKEKEKSAIQAYIDGLKKSAEIKRFI